MTRFLPVFGDRRKRRIGLLGGSFNPAHDGHLHISREAMKLLGLDEVWWLVSPQNPLKPARGMAPLANRLAAARAKTAGTQIRISDLESKLGTVRTAKVVANLQQRFPNIAFVWLMGADNLEQFPQWWRWTQIFHTVRVAVLDRSPYAYRALAGAAAQRFRRSRTRPTRALFKSNLPAWSYLAIKRHDASGTAIRQLHIQATESPRPQRQETTITTATTAGDLESKIAAIITSLDDDKGRDIVRLNLAGKSSMADCMIVASGTSTRAVSAMAEHVVTKLKGLGFNARSEGRKQGDWVLVDSGDVVVQIFRPEVRAFYDIERLWTNAAPLPVKPAAPVAPAPVAAPVAPTPELALLVAAIAKPKARKPAAKKKAKAKPKVKAKKKVAAKAKPKLKAQPKAKPKTKAKTKTKPKAKKKPARKPTRKPARKKR